MTSQMEKILKGDKTIFLVVVLLMVISSLAAGTVHSTLAIHKHTFSFIFLIKQLFFSAIAFITIILFANIPYPVYSKLAKQAYYFMLFLMLVTIIAGVSINDSKRWLAIPFVGLTIQTSDFARISLIILVAHLISREKPGIEGKDKLMDKLMIWSAPMLLLIAKNDLSTALIAFFVVLVLSYFTGIENKLFFKKVGIYAGIGIILLSFAILFHVGRSETWIGRLQGKGNKSVVSQKVQGKIAIAQAHFIPKPGSSKQKYVLANSYSDYIFDVLIEEYGILGAIVIIPLYLILFYRIYMIIRRQRRTFPLYLALGLALNLVIQTFVHIYVNLGIGPVTGQPLPLISMGGSSTFSTALQLGIILNISYLSSKKPVEARAEKETKEEEKLTAEVEVDVKDYPILIG